MNIAFFGSSLVSAYWNGAATYYRGMLRALHQRGHQITFYESDAFGRQQHRDMPDPDYARVVVYPGQGEAGVLACLDRARSADLVIKASGNGVFDELLEAAVASMASPTRLVAFWDVDAPATLERVIHNTQDPFRTCIPRYDVIFTYGGGQPVIDAYTRLNARQCVPIYNALDPITHHPVTPDAAQHARFAGDLALLANRLPDREARIDAFFFKPADRLPKKRFLLGGSGWDGKPMPPSVTPLGHVYTRDHNALNCASLAVLNVHRDSMARYGFSPATRVFEAIGAGACMISDAAPGLESFFTPGEEILLASSGDEVTELLASLSPLRAARIGQAGYRRCVAHHTYAHRAELFDKTMGVLGASRSVRPRPTPPVGPSPVAVGAR